jgi:cytidylate kinase
VAELRGTGAQVDYEKTLAEIRERDHRDASRDVAPMKPADDAVLVDSSTQTIEQVVENLAQTVEARASQNR